MTDAIKENILETGALFTEPTIGEESAENLCFSACFPLLLNFTNAAIG
jgi:hypothetical protein